MCINISTNKVDDNNPNTIVTAIGFKNWVCTLFSNNMGLSQQLL